MNTITRMEELLSRAEPLLDRLEARDAMFEVQMNKMADYLKTIKWVVGIVLLPTLGLLISNQVQISQAATKEEVRSGYVHHEQVIDAFSYTSDELYYALKSMNDSAIKRPYVIDMSVVKSILKRQ